MPLHRLRIRTLMITVAAIGLASDLVRALLTLGHRIGADHGWFASTGRGAARPLEIKMPEFPFGWVDLPMLAALLLIVIFTLTRPDRRRQPLDTRE